MEYHFTPEKHAFFYHLCTSIFTLVSMAQTIEIYVRGSAEPYRDLDSIVLDSKQNQESLRFFPRAQIELISKSQWPNLIVCDRKTKPIDPGAHLDLGALQMPLSMIYQPLFIQFYEQMIPGIKKRYGEAAQNWPAPWNFARVVRNAAAHGGVLTFTNPKAATVKWKSVSLSPSDNGRYVFQTDIWPGDVIVLMDEMNRTI